MKDENVFDAIVRASKETITELFGKDAWNRFDRNRKHKLIMRVCEDGIKKAEERAENGNHKD